MGVEPTVQRYVNGRDTRSRVEVHACIRLPEIVGGTGRIAIVVIGGSSFSSGNGGGRLVDCLRLTLTGRSILKLAVVFKGHGI